MRRILALTAALVVFSMACSDIAGPLGPLGFGVIQGREQQAVAGDAQLDTAVVAKVWRDASGQAFIGAAPLHAQSTVTGVAGAVVCVGEVPIQGDPVIPHARCTATESDGTATFHIAPPTRAATHVTPIVAEVDGTALTPDTVTVVVSAGAPVAGLGFDAAPSGAGVSGDTLDLNHASPQDAFGNPVPWRLAVLTGSAHVISDDISNDSSRMLVPEVDEGTGAVRIYTEAQDSVDGTWESYLSDGSRYVRVAFPGH